MSETKLIRHSMEKIQKKTSVQESQKLNQIFFSKHLNKVHPIGLQKSSSSSSLSSLSSSLSQTSNESYYMTDSLTIADENISLALHLISPRQSRKPTVTTTAQKHQSPQIAEPGELRRCNWLTKNCGMVN